MKSLLTPQKDMLELTVGTMLLRVKYITHPEDSRPKNLLMWQFN